MHFVKMVSLLLLACPAAPMLDALAAGLRECSRKPITGERLHFLDGFLNNMLRSRISRRVLAEQHLMLDVPRYWSHVFRLYWVRVSWQVYAEHPTFGSMLQAGLHWRHLHRPTCRNSCPLRDRKVQSGALRPGVHAVINA